MARAASRNIHRDLKPANIFLARPGNGMGEVVKVLDFGVAKFLSTEDDAATTRTRIETERGVLVGTPAYMSPEQLLGEALNESWDVWALSVIAYESLSAELPFGHGGPDRQRAVVAGKFVPLSDHRPELHARWNPFFKKCFAADPRRRPSSAAEFLRELEQTVGSTSPHS